MLNHPNARPSNLSLRVPAALRKLEKTDPERAAAIRAVLQTNTSTDVEANPLGLTGLPHGIDATRLRIVKITKPRRDNELLTFPLRAEDGTWGQEDPCCDDIDEWFADPANLRHDMERELDPDELSNEVIDPIYFISRTDHRRIANARRYERNNVNRDLPTIAKAFVVAGVNTRGYAKKLLSGGNGDSLLARPSKTAQVNVVVRKPLPPHLTDRVLNFTDQFPGDFTDGQMRNKRRHSSPGRTKTGARPVIRL